MIRQTLHDNWMLRPAGDVSDVPSSLRSILIPARVPGCVHTDLLRANLIGDPYQAFNERELQWIGLADWNYTTTFTADEQLFTHDRIDLAADGLDTVATIELNGQAVATTANMHRGYRFDVKGLLARGSNTLSITFASPVRYAQAMRERLGPRPYVNGPAGPFNFIRKMACNFGWDWGPALPTSGIWRGIRLEGWSDSRIVSVRPFVSRKLDRRSTKVRFVCDIEFADAPPKPVAHPRLPKLSITLEIYLEGQDPSDNAKAVRDVWQAYVQESRIIIEAEVRNAKPWWPNGHGEQALRDYRVSLGDRHSIVDEFKGRLGVRSIELDTSPDSIGSRFALKINGKEIFCKGFNWIPDDCFLDRACDPSRVRQRIGQCVDAGGNMLRVWGGGIYETDAFYDICDELGVMVWQDFLFACAMYPEKEPLRAEVEAEARHNVARLSTHPSLVIWNGCNENIWGYKDWGWKDHPDVAGKTWGRGYYLDLLPKIVQELDDGSRPYWAASPWSGDPDVENGLAPNLSTHGNKHVWEAWFKENYDAYRQFAPRFCSEFGFQGPATYSSIASVVPPDALDFGSRDMRHRQKSGDPVRDDGDRRNLRHLIRHFNLPGAEGLLKSLDPPDPNAKVPECGCGPLHAARHGSSVNFDDLHYLLSLNQARALTLGVEWFRSRQPVCMGTLYWQLNDCWPGGTTWSCIDGSGRKKPLWYATRRFYAPRLLTIQPEADALVLYANNDSDEPWSGEVRLHRLNFHGIVQGVFTLTMDVPPRTNQRLGVLPTVIAQPRDRGGEFIVADASTEARGVYFFEADRQLAYPEPQFEGALNQTANGYDFTITSRVLLRDVLLQTDRLDPDAQIDDNLITILPGEPRTFRITTSKELSLDKLTRRPVFNCANDFGKRD